MMTTERWDWETSPQECPGSRDNQKPDTYYTCPDGTVFVTPDGVGRFWFDSLEEAEAEYPVSGPTVHLDYTPED